MMMHIEYFISQLGNKAVDQANLALGFPVVLKPENTEQVSSILTYCNEHLIPVVPIGGNTNVVGSTHRLDKEIGLSLERMNTIESIDVANRSMLVQAGVILQNAQQYAEENDLLLALDFGARGSATIGGCAATNAGGNQVVRYGMAREQILGLEVVLADGTVVDSLSDVIKNNTGYDLKQWFIGAEGTLGIITRINLRLRSLSQTRHTALVAVDKFENLAKLMHEVDRNSGGMLLGYEVMWQNYYHWVVNNTPNTAPLESTSPYYALVELCHSRENEESNIFENILQLCFEKHLIRDAAIAQSEKQRTNFWSVRDAVSYLIDLEYAWVYDVSLAIDDMEIYSQRVEAKILQEWPETLFTVFGHLGDGNIHLIIQVPGLEDEQAPFVFEQVNEIVYGEVKHFNGSISAEHGIGIDKKKHLDKSRSSAEITLMKNMKNLLDKNNILNPGKIF